MVFVQEPDIAVVPFFCVFNIVMCIRLVGLHAGLLFKDRDAGMPVLPVLPGGKVILTRIGDRLVIHIRPIKLREGVLDVFQAA